MQATSNTDTQTSNNTVIGPSLVRAAPACRRRNGPSPRLLGPPRSASTNSVHERFSHGAAQPRPTVGRRRLAVFAYEGELTDHQQQEPQIRSR